MQFSIPPGLQAAKHVDLRSDEEIDDAIENAPTTVSGSKNVWFFWHSGYKTMYPYTKRNIRAWYRRFTGFGWMIRVVDYQSVANFVDVQDSSSFPQAFIDGTISGDYAQQHISDLVRWPLLLQYGGVYADVGYMQIGDLDRLWNETIGDPRSPTEVIAFVDAYSLTNYFLASGPENELFTRCHKLLLALWAEDGGKVSTEGMSRSPLLKGTPMMAPTLTFEEDGKTVGSEETSRMITDYIIQGQVTAMVMGLVDEEGQWDGPTYVKNHLYAMDYMVGSQLINEITAWDGLMAFRLMSLPLPKDDVGEVESSEQKQAREIVESCLERSFGFKLAHGIISRIVGHTIGTLWREHEGCDIVPGTYAHWLRYGMVHWNQDSLPARLHRPPEKPFKVGPLLREL